MTPERWQRIEELLHATLELKPQDRSRFLAEAGGEDNLLRSEVESLVKAHEEAGDFIESPAMEIAAKAMASSEPHSLTGQMVAHFKIVSPLGAGGMGEVYLAEDLKLGRRVALKVLPAISTTSKESRTRFLREARLASVLDHPNICTVHEIGQDSGRHFIAMQYIEGETLKKVVGNRPLDLDALLSIGIQVADALSEAHSRGIVHRDIKSSNIIITTRGQAKVLDFGLAKSLESAVGASSSAAEMELTRTSVAMGTPAYMSPEQARGEAVDRRSDIFSFGALLYEMATGRVPFKEKSRAETMNAIINKPHTPAIELNKELPAALSGVIDRALAKLPDDRYQSMQEVLEQLREAAREAGLISTGSPDGVRAPYVAPGRRKTLAGLKRSLFRPAPVAAVAGLLALLVAVYVVRVMWNSPTAPAQINSIAVLPFKPLNADSRDESLEMGMANTLITRLSELRQVKVRPIDSVRSYATIDQDPVAAGRQLRVDSVLYGHIQKSGDRIRVTAHLVRVSDGAQLWRDTLDDVYKNIFAVQDSISEKVVGALAMELSLEERRRLARHHTENAEAYQSYVRGQYHLDKWTTSEVKKGIQHFEQAIIKDGRYALAYTGLAESYFVLSVMSVLPYNDAVPRAKQYLARAMEIDETLAETHGMMGQIMHMYDWDWAGAEREFNLAIQLNSNSGRTYRNYALYLVDMGRFDEAITAIRNASEREPLSAYISRDAGQVLYYAGRYDEAIEACKEAIEIDRNLASWLDRAYEAKGLRDEAVEANLFEEANQGASAETVAAMRAAYKKSGWQGYWRKNLDELKKKEKEGYVQAYRFVEVYARLGEKEGALEWLEKGLIDRNAWMPTIKNDPLLDGLRAEPRFNEVLGRVGLAQ